MPRKPRLGLALGSGAARGWAHIGVIRALERLGIRPDLIAGCS
ncbi:MAG: patatin-like phospholipase family protein, partial [Aeromonas veronii]